MSPNSKDNKRFRLLINPSFQWSFLASAAAASLLVSLVYFTATTYFFWKLEGIGHDIGLSENHIFFRFIETQKSNLDLVLLATTVLAISILSLWGLYLSNRVAGPLKRLQEYLEDFRDGKTHGPLSFRQKDYFQELPQAINEALAILDKDKKVNPTDGSRTA